jgi:hypothetical protein
MRARLLRAACAAALLAALPSAAAQALAMASSNIGRAKDLYAAFSVEPAGAVPVAEVVS